MRSRGFCFTINNYDNDDLSFIMDKEYIGYRYIIVGFEVAPTTKTPHMQGYVYFDNARSETNVRYLFSPNHIEVQRGTNEQAINYCKGIANDKNVNDDIYENGEPPSSGKALFATIESAMLNPEENMQVFHQYRKTYKEYMRNKKKEHDRVLMLVSTEDKWEYLKQFTSVSFDQETYDDEDVLVLSAYSSIRLIDNWVHGYPEKIRRGYEIIPVDPKVIVLIYNDGKELNYAIKNFADYAELYKKNM